MEGKVFAIALEVGYNNGTRMIMGGMGLPQPEGDVPKPAQVRTGRLTCHYPLSVRSTCTSCSSSDPAGCKPPCRRCGGVPAQVVCAADAQDLRRPEPKQGVLRARHVYLCCLKSRTHPLSSHLMRISPCNGLGTRQFDPLPTQLLQWLEMCTSGAGKGKITPQPLYEFMADKVVNGRLILMGDAAHMASPRTAAGAHTGILDAAGLLEALSAHPNK